MRAIWKGHIRFSLVTIPICVYNAVESARTISFNQLHKEDNGRIGYDKKCKVCGDAVKTQEIIKGYEHEPDQYVVFESEDFEKVKLKSTKVIEMEGFVDVSEVDITLYDSPYFIGPDGPVAAKTYALLSDALRETGKLGIGKVVLRDREDAVLVGPHPEGSMLYKIRYPETLRKMSGVPMLEEHETDPEQLKLAVSLIESMETTLDKIELKDQYQDALREMIQAKIDGQEIVSATEEEPQIIDIMSALKQSIEESQAERKPMAKSATAKKATKKPKKAAAKKAKVA
jgi:DNA end-binding protein Ku